jgi:hypothetical protein
MHARSATLAQNADAVGRRSCTDSMDSDARRIEAIRLRTGSKYATECAFTCYASATLGGDAHHPERAIGTLSRAEHTHPLLTLTHDSGANCLAPNTNPLLVWIGAFGDAMHPGSDLALSFDTG